MRKYIILLIFAFVMACTKKTNPVTPNTPSTPQQPNNPVTPTTARYIPNWRTDTLTGLCVDINGDPIYDSSTWEAIYDTLYTYSINDTSFVVYNGVRYYIWWKPATPIDSFENNSIMYVNCDISTTGDTTGIINQYMVSVRPYRYWDDFYKDWANQKQQLWGHSFNTKYKVFFSTYTSIKK